jgi:type 1 glutamine amidotransferase
MKFLLTLSLLLSTAFAQEARRIEVLFLGDKGHHKPIERVPQLMAALGPKGINITYTDDLSDLNPKTLGKYDALMIFANWDTLPAPAEKALLDFVASGKGFLPIHCASYCFRNSSEYVKLVGGQFWRHTMDSITAQIVQPQHAVMADLKPFTAYDETYLHSQLQPDNNVLAVREIKADQKKDKPGASTEPYTWTRTHGKGKVFYTAYGHDERTWQLAGFQELLYNGIIWSVNDAARAAHVARAPQKFEYRTAKLPNYEQRPGIQYQQLALNPEESMKHIQVPVDFNLELFAAEPNVMHPIAVSWDEQGKLYVLITKDYPNERKQEGGSDYIMVCEDTDKDGKADKFTPFAEGLIMKEWNSRTKYCYAKLNKDTWWVTLSPEDNAMTYLSLTMHPKFRRVRVLNAVHGANDRTYLCCTCKTMEQCGYVCRHILSVVGDGSRAMA